MVAVALTVGAAVSGGFAQGEEKPSGATAVSQPGQDKARQLKWASQDTPILVARPGDAVALENLPDGFNGDIFVTARDGTRREVIAYPSDMPDLAGWTLVVPMRAETLATGDRFVVDIGGVVGERVLLVETKPVKGPKGALKNLVRNVVAGVVDSLHSAGIDPLDLLQRYKEDPGGISPALTSAAQLLLLFADPSHTGGFQALLKSGRLPTLRSAQPDIDVASAQPVLDALAHLLAPELTGAQLPPGVGTKTRNSPLLQRIGYDPGSRAGARLHDLVYRPHRHGDIRPHRIDYAPAIKIYSFTEIGDALKKADAVRAKQNLVAAAKKYHAIAEWTIGLNPAAGTALGIAGLSLSLADQHYRAVNHGLPKSISVAVEARPKQQFLANDKTLIAFQGAIRAESEPYDILLIRDVQDLAIGVVGVLPIPGGSAILRAMGRVSDGAMAKKLLDQNKIDKITKKIAATEKYLSRFKPKPPTPKDVTAKQDALGKATEKVQAVEKHLSDLKSKPKGERNSKIIAEGEKRLALLKQLRDRKAMELKRLGGPPPTAAQNLEGFGLGRGQAQLKEASEDLEAGKLPGKRPAKYTLYNVPAKRWGPFDVTPINAKGYFNVAYFGPVTPKPSLNKARACWDRSPRPVEVRLTTLPEQFAGRRVGDVAFATVQWPTVSISPNRVRARPEQVVAFEADYDGAYQDTMRWVHPSEGSKVAQTDRKPAALSWRMPQLEPGRCQKQLTVTAQYPRTDEGLCAAAPQAEATVRIATTDGLIEAPASLVCRPGKTVDFTVSHPDGKVRRCALEGPGSLSFANNKGTIQCADQDGGEATLRCTMADQANSCSPNIPVKYGDLRIAAFVAAASCGKIGGGAFNELGFDTSDRYLNAIRRYAPLIGHVWAGPGTPEIVARTLASQVMVMMKENKHLTYGNSGWGQMGAEGKFDYAVMPYGQARGLIGQTLSAASEGSCGVGGGNVVINADATADSFRVQSSGAWKTSHTGLNEAAGTFVILYKVDVTGPTRVRVELKASHTGNTTAGIGLQQPFLLLEEKYLVPTINRLPGPGAFVRTDLVHPGLPNDQRGRRATELITLTGPPEGVESLTYLLFFNGGSGAGDLGSSGTYSADLEAKISIEPMQEPPGPLPPSANKAPSQSKTPSSTALPSLADQIMGTAGKDAAKAMQELTKEFEAIKQQMDKEVGKAAEEAAHEALHNTGTPPAGAKEGGSQSEALDTLQQQQMQKIQQQQRGQ